MSFKKIFEENIKHPHHIYELNHSYMEVLEEFVKMINEQTTFQVSSDLIKTGKGRYRLNLYAKFRPVIYSCLMSVVPKENNSIEIWNENHIKCNEASSLRSYLEEAILNPESTERLTETMVYLENENKKISSGNLKLSEDILDYINIETDQVNQKKLFEFLNNPNITSSKIETSRTIFSYTPNIEQYKIISSAGLEAKIEKIEAEDHDLIIWLTK